MDILSIFKGWQLPGVGLAGKLWLILVNFAPNSTIYVLLNPSTAWQAANTSMLVGDSGQLGPHLSNIRDLGFICELLLCNVEVQTKADYHYCNFHQMKLLQGELKGQCLFLKKMSARLFSFPPLEARYLRIRIPKSKHLQKEI